jgi:hypothetical protein
MKRIIASSLLIFGCFNGIVIFCQQSDSRIDHDQPVIKKDTIIISDDHKAPKTKKMNTGLEVGTSFMYSPNYYYAPSVFIAPNINYRLSSKFLLHAGLIYEKSSVHTLYSVDNQSDKIIPLNRTYLYAGGSYLVGPKLTISGSVFKLINNTSNSTHYQNPYYMNAQGFQLDLNYKVSNSISVGFQVRQQNNYLDQTLIHY